MTEGVYLKDGECGRRAVVTTAWSDAISQYLLDNKIVELELNYAKGWSGEDLAFLAAFPDLQAFEIIDRRISSIAPIHLLHELRILKVMTYCETEIDFSAFPHLQQCSLEWRRKVTSLFECVTLKKLFLNRYKGRNVDAFAKLTALESLSILGAPVENLLGLRNLVHLTYLRLGLLTKLRSLAGIEGLANLEELNINTCRAIGSIDEVSNLRKLKRLFLSNCGRIESLKPLKDLDCLKTVGFSESTNIVDGDLSPLMHQKNLSQVTFQNRRHYSHRREDFGTAYFGKRDERRDDGSQ